MSTSSVNPAIHLLRTHGHRPAGGRPHGFDKLRVGQELNLAVLRQIDERHFLVALGGNQHVVESALMLTAGSRVRATVVSVEDRLELRYLNSASPEADDEAREIVSDNTDAGMPAAILVSSMAERYRLTLAESNRQRIARAAAEAGDPPVMAASGLYLARLAVPLNDSALQAVYAAQTTHAGDKNAARPPADISGLVAESPQPGSGDLSALAALLSEAFPQDASTDQHDDGRQDLARQLLNLQDDGSTAYRYGTLPVLVAGQLVELDLVLFQQREQSAGSTAIRRLVMTLKTDSLGPVQVEARALDNRVVVTFTGQSADTASELAAHAADVRGLIERLGWNVEAIHYEASSGTQRAARHIVEHVLASGSVDVLF